MLHCSHGCICFLYIHRSVMKELSRAVSTGMPAKDSLELVKKVGVAKIKSSGKGLSNCWEHFTELRWHSREIARYTRTFSSAGKLLWLLS